MKLLLDENVSPNWSRFLQQQFRVHTFSSTEAEHLRGVDDAELFADAANRGFDALVTNDVRQMERQGERRALFQSGMSWIGIDSGSNVQGRTALLLQLATLIAGLAVLQHSWRTEPWAYRLKHVPATEAARLDSFDLWHDDWGPRPA